MNKNQIISDSVVIGKGTKIWNFVNIYGNVMIGRNCMIGTFVEIQDSVSIGFQTKISSHSFICSNVKIGSNCFIGHGVKFCNDNFEEGVIHYNKEDWGSVTVENNVNIGSGSTILSNVTIGENSVIGAGSVVTKSIPPNSIAYGNPAKVVRKIPIKYFVNKRENTDITI